MSGRAPWLLLPVVAVYVGLLAPLVVVGVSFVPSAAFAFPPAGFTLHWFAQFFGSDAYIRSFFRVSLEKPVFTVIFSGVAALATAINEAAKHL